MLENNTFVFNGILLDNILIELTGNYTHIKHMLNSYHAQVNGIKLKIIVPKQKLQNIVNSLLMIDFCDCRFIEIFIIPS